MHTLLKKNKIIIPAQTVNMKSMLKITLPVCLLLLSVSVIAQDYYPKWDATFTSHREKPGNEKESAVILEEERVHEYKADDNKKSYDAHSSILGK